MPTVLIADDEPDVHTLLKEHLDRSFRVISAFDGDEALERIEADAPDLVVLDIAMPHVDGRDVLLALKKKERMPIVVLFSARDSQHDRIAGLEMGAQDYVTKPMPMRLLARKIERLLSTTV